MAVLSNFGLPLNNNKILEKQTNDPNFDPIGKALHRVPASRDPMAETGNQIFT
jgi:hypothetical protein